MAQIALASMTDYYAPSVIEQYAKSTAIAYQLPVDEFLGTIQCESGFYYKARGALGERGVVQIYPKAHPDITFEQMEDPYWSISWMAQEWLKGNQRAWTCWRIHYSQEHADAPGA